jgi:hypothetical protein
MRSGSFRKRADDAFLSRSAVFSFSAMVSMFPHGVAGVPPGSEPQVMPVPVLAWK